MLSLRVPYRRSLAFHEYTYTSWCTSTINDTPVSTHWVSTSTNNTITKYFIPKGRWTHDRQCVSLTITNIMPTSSAVLTQKRKNRAISFSVLPNHPIFFFVQRRYNFKAATSIARSEYRKIRLWFGMRDAAVEYWTIAVHGTDMIPKSKLIFN